MPPRLALACLIAALPVAVRPVAAKVCIDEGTITSLQVSGSGPESQWLQIKLDQRAVYVATTAALPAVFSGYASLVTAAYFAGRPIRVGYEQGPTSNNIQFLELPAQGAAPPVTGCPAHGGPAARR
ncbi:MAG: hypothetical protein ACRYGM_12405 [Janthinobacterium lividum]